MYKKSKKNIILTLLAILLLALPLGYFIMINSELPTSSDKAQDLSSNPDAQYCIQPAEYARSNYCLLLIMTSQKQDEPSFSSQLNYEVIIEEHELTPYIKEGYASYSSALGVKLLVEKDSREKVVDTLNKDPRIVIASTDILSFSGGIR